MIAALETGRTSWTQLPGAVRLGPDDDRTVVTRDPDPGPNHPDPASRLTATTEPTGAYLERQVSHEAAGAAA